jgi:hypothetical protein
MGDRDEDIIVQAGSSTRWVHLGIDALGGAEQHQGLIDEVTAEVEQRAPAGRGWTRIRLEALEARLEPHGVAEPTVREQLLHRTEIRIPAPVLKYRQRHA